MVTGPVASYIEFINGQSLTGVIQHPYLGVCLILPCHSQPISAISHVSNAMGTLNFVKRNKGVALQYILYSDLHPQSNF